MGITKEKIPTLQFSRITVIFFTKNVLVLITNLSEISEHRYNSLNKLKSLLIKPCSLCYQWNVFID